MALFEEVKLEWGGKEFAIAPDRVMRAIALVEEIVTIPELAREMQSGEFRCARLAEAYAALLRYAGARASQEEVYAVLFPSLGGDQTLRIASAVMTLLSMMVPPAAWKKTASAEEAGASPGKAPAES